MASTKTPSFVHSTISEKSCADDMAIESAGVPDKPASETASGERPWSGALKVVIIVVEVDDDDDDDGGANNGSRGTTDVVDGGCGSGDDDDDDGDGTTLAPFWLVLVVGVPGGRNLFLRSLTE